MFSISSKKAKLPFTSVLHIPGCCQDCSSYRLMREKLTVLLLLLLLLLLAVTLMAIMFVKS